MTAICPCCGYNLTADEPIVLGDWRIVPRVGAFYKGELVAQRRSWVEILLGVARMQGAAIPSEALLNRFSDSENTDVLHSQVSQLRKALTLRGIDIPIAGVRKAGGYQWTGGRRVGRPSAPPP